MATVYNGNGSLVSATSGAGNRTAINSSTNAAPIAVSATAHGYNTGDSVEIEGHLTNTAANGFWQITRIDANTFSLNGSTGNGVGGATGYSIGYELQPAYTIPAGGELLDPGVSGALFEGIANVAPWLYRAAGKFKIYNYYQSSFAGASAVGAAPWYTDNAVVVTGTWLSNAGLRITLKSIAANPSGPDPYLGASDILVVTASVSVAVADVTQPLNSADAFGIGMTMGGTNIRGQVLLAQSAPYPSPPSYNVQSIAPITITASFFPTTDYTPGVGQNLQIVYQRFNGFSDTNNSIRFSGAWAINAYQLRAL
jgi:hypothetical protein